MDTKELLDSAPVSNDGRSVPEGTLVKVQSAEANREQKLKRLAKIVAAIKRDQAQGKRLFAYCNPDQAIYDYYRSERSANSAHKKLDELYDKEGCFVRLVTVYPDVYEIELGYILGILEMQQNPFAYLDHGYSKYPYNWLQQIEELFLTDPSNPRGGWDECLLPNDHQSG